MILSMTGYANSSIENTFGRFTLELRSVNHRYLDVQFRMADELRSIESILRETASAQLKRGKVECRFQRFPEVVDQMKIGRTYCKETRNQNP